MSWGPWRRVRDAVLRAPSSPWTAAERLVALVVADCIGDDGTARPSVALVAARSALGRRTVQRALAKLAGAGGIFVESTGGSSADRGRLSSVYRLATSATVARVPAPQRRRYPRQIDQRHSGTGATDDADQRHGGAPRTKEGLIDHAAARRVAARVVRKRKPGGNGSANGDPWVGLACEDWNARFGAGSAQGGRIAGGLGPVVKANSWSVIRPAWQRYLRETRHPAPSAQDFAAHWLDWKAEASGPPRVEEAGPIILGPRSA